MARTYHDHHLPHMKHNTGIRRSAQIAFGGIVRTEAASDGDIYEMRNMSARDYPLLSARHPRAMRDVGVISSLSSDGAALFWVDKSVGERQGHLIYNDNDTGVVLNAKPKRYAVMYETILIFPDKVYYNTKTGESGSIDAHSGAAEYVDESNKRLVFSSPLITFRAGDVVRIRAVPYIKLTGADGNVTESPLDEETLEAVIASVSNHYVKFREVKQGAKVLYEEFPFRSGYAKWEVVDMARVAPDLETLCACNNRVFGTVGNQIYASALGDVTNWQDFRGISTDSWYLDTGNPQPFTACAVVSGRPVFFTETDVTVLYGSYPSAYSTSVIHTPGVRAGSAASVTALGDYLYYLSLYGLCRFSVSGGATVISDVLGVRIMDCVSATDGRGVLFCCYGDDGSSFSYRLSGKSGTFCGEDELPFLCLCRLRGAIVGTDGRTLYHMSEDGEIPDGYISEDFFTCRVIFSPFREDHATSSSNYTMVPKRGHRLIIRYKAVQAPVRVYLRIDGEPSRIVYARENCMDEDVAVVPLPPFASDKYTVEIESEIGQDARFMLMGMAREYSYYN